MNLFLQLVISGAAVGAIYSLVAAGLTVSYTATGIFNLSYGAIAYVSAFLYYQLNTGLGWPIAWAFLFVLLVFCPLLGLLLDIAVFRHLARAPDAAKIMATVGLLVALPALARYIVEGGITTFGWGIPDGRLITIAPGIWRSPPSVSHLWFDVRLNSNQIVIFVTAVLVAASLWYLLRRTRLGLQMRAVVDRPDLAAMRGVSDARTSAYAWVIGTMLAGLAGVVGAPVLGSLHPAQFNVVMFVAAAAVVLGGLRSVPLAFAGGLLLGILESLVAQYAGFARQIEGFRSSVPFLVLLVGLLFLARDRARRGGSIIATPPPANWTDDLPRWRVALPWAAAVALFTVWIFVVLDRFWLGLLTGGLAYGVILLSFVVVTGLGGMVSLAQAAFVSMAAFVAGLCMVRYDLPWLAAVVIGTLVAMLLGVVVALPALRLGGLPLALATLALGFLGDRVLFKWNWLRNSQSGWSIRPPSIGPIDFRDTRTTAVGLMIVLGLLSWLVHNLQRSASGRTMVAVRNSEPAAATSGISIARTKLAIFAVSAGIAGFGGVLLATYNRHITEGTFTTSTGLLWLAIVVLFGIRKPQGAIIGGLLIATAPTIFNNGFHWWFLPSFLHWDGLGTTTATHISAALFGIGAVQLARQPDGVLAITSAQNRARRDRRRARLELAAVGATSAEPPAPAVSAATSTVVPSPGAPPTSGDGASEPAPTRGSADRAGEPGEAEPSGPIMGLELHDVRGGYGAVRVLHGISLSVASGHITALLGPNGAGKSTTCAMVAGILRPTSGAILADGEDVTGLRAHERAKRGIVLAPEARGVFAGLTVRENLQMWLPNSADRDRAYERFPILGERRNQLAGNLSGGEQQILTLAPLLVHPPRVLVADEPSLGLAPLIVNQIMELFVELRERGVALLLVEEKARDVLAIADQVAFLDLGRVSWSGPRDQVDMDQLSLAYLGSGQR